jgi:DNA-binding NtrC family response regulator
VLVFSADPELMHTVTEAAQGRFPIHIASNIVQVVRILIDHQPGVLVTDVTRDRMTIQTMTASLKRHLPELVTVVVSEHRDALDMVWLINHGQIFRFLRTPVSPGRCAVSLQAALQHHRTLLANPVLAGRHVVDSSDDSGVFSGVFEKLKSVRRLWA